MIPWHWAAIFIIAMLMFFGVLYFVFIREDRSGDYSLDVVGPLGCMTSIALGATGIAIVLAVAGWIR